MFEYMCRPSIKFGICYLLVTVIAFGMELINWKWRLWSTKGHSSQAMQLINSTGRGVTFDLAIHMHSHHGEYNLQTAIDNQLLKAAPLASSTVLCQDQTPYIT